MAQAKQQPPKRTPDAFQRARQIYQARTRHFEKAAELLRSADPHTKALVEAQEEADAQAADKAADAVDAPE